MLHVEQQERLIADAGLSGQIKPDPWYTREMLDDVIESKRAENMRGMIASKANGWQFIPNLAAGFAGGALDPINIASCFIPVVPEAMAAGMVARAGGAAGRALARGMTGAASGAVGAAMVEPLIYHAQQKVQADYDMYASLSNIAFGAALGAALPAATGWLGDRMRGKLGLNAGTNALPVTEQSLALMASHQAEIEAKLATANPSLSPEQVKAGAERAARQYDNYVRTHAKERGISVEDGYKEFRLEYEAAGNGAELGESGGEGETYYSLKKIDADNVDDFVDASPSREQAGSAALGYYIYDNKVSNKQVHTFNSYEIHLTDDRLAHIKKRHSGFNRWKEIPEVINEGEVFPFAVDRKTGKEQFAFVKKENGQSFVVIGMPIQASKGYNNRMRIMTAFVDNDKKVSNWIKQNAVPGRFGAGGLPAYPGHDRPAYSTLSDGLDSIASNAPDVNPPTTLNQGDGIVQGSITFLTDKHALIRFFDSASYATPVHEISHAILKRMADDVKSPNASAMERERWERLSSWLGVEPGAPLTREAHEKYARAMEKYLHEGVAPEPRLEGYFREAAEEMRKLYNQADFANVDISPEVREIFDRLNTIPIDEAEYRYRKAIGDVYSDDLTKHLIDEEGLAEAGRKAEQGELSLEDMSALADADVARAGELLASLEGERPEFVAQAREELRQARADLERELAEIGERGKLMEQFVSCQLGI